MYVALELGQLRQTSFPYPQAILQETQQYDQDKNDPFHIADY
jgi:hypothetical protein